VMSGAKLEDNIKVYLKYEGRIKSSCTGGSAPLLCRGRR
jgi:hypothetical protein